MVEGSSMNRKSLKITIYISPELKQKLEEEARRDHKMLSELIRDILVERIYK